MAIPAVAWLQQHDARRDILIEPAVRQHAAIEALGHSELGAQSGRKNRLVLCIFVYNFCLKLLALLVVVSLLMYL